MKLFILFSMAFKNLKKYEKLLGIAALFMLVLALFLKYRQNNHIQEAVHLPFHSVQLEDVADGTYSGKTYTSFMHLQLEVQVENHCLKDIKIVENSGSQGLKAKELTDEMIAENKVKVPVIEKDELGSIVIISCVDTALYEGLPEELKEKYSSQKS